MSESSAAGYQLRRHYQKHLLKLECLETGKNMDDLIAVAEKQKKKKKEKEPASTPSSAGATAGPPSAQPQPQQPPPQMPQQQQPPPPQQTLQPPPQPYSQPPHGKFKNLHKNGFIEMAKKILKLFKKRNIKNENS